MLAPVLDPRQNGHISDSTVRGYDGTMSRAFSVGHNDFVDHVDQVTTAIGTGFAERLLEVVDWPTHRYLQARPAIGDPRSLLPSERRRWVSPNSADHTGAGRASGQSLRAWRPSAWKLRPRHSTSDRSPPRSP